MSAPPLEFAYAPRELTAFVNRPIVGEHAELGAHLWEVRRDAVDSWNFDLADLLDVDDRLEGNLAGLALAGPEAFEICNEVLDAEDASTSFVIMLTAMRQRAHERLTATVEEGTAESDRYQALASALAWEPFASVRPIVDWLDASDDVGALSLVVDTSTAAGMELPEDAIAKTIARDVPALSARAARHIGALGRHALAAHVYPLVQHADDSIRFEAAWTTLRLGQRYREPAMWVLDQLAANPDSPLRDAALQWSLRFRIAREAQARYEAIRESLDPAQRHAAIAAIGVPELVATLLEDCADPEIAATSANAYAIITGVDLEYDDLDADRDDDDDDDNDDDDDDDLPFPDLPRLLAHWEQLRTHYAAGHRYLAGRPISVDNLQHVLRTGKQQVRRFAAWELARLEPTTPMLDSGSRAHTQRQKYLGWTS